MGMSCLYIKILYQQQVETVGGLSSPNPWALVWMFWDGLLTSQRQCTWSISTVLGCSYAPTKKMYIEWCSKCSSSWMDISDFAGICIFFSAEDVIKKIQQRSPIGDDLITLQLIHNGWDGLCSIHPWSKCFKTCPVLGCYWFIHLFIISITTFFESHCFPFILWWGVILSSRSHFF